MTDEIQTKLFIPCTPVRLPPELEMPAAMRAIAENPVNQPPGPPHPDRLGALTSKYWGAKGVVLSVGFLEATPADLAARIIDHMNAWRTVGLANVTFRQTAQVGSADVRITRSGDGYWSYLGTDIRSIPSSEPTMCLQAFVMATPESEYRRVVRHETGHTLGFPHEHMRKAIVDLLDREKTIAYFGRFQGWDRQTVIEQVLTPVPEAALLNPTPADRTSIMAYQLPAAITKNGVPIAGGSDIDDLDRAYAAKIYPLPAAPPPPPPGEVGPIVRLVGYDAGGKEVARFAR